MNQDSTPTFSASEEPSGSGFPQYPLLSDPWETTGPIPLDGWFERHAFSPITLAVIVSISLFVLFQVIGAVFSIFLMLLQGLGTVQREDIPELIGQMDPVFLLLGNGFGQVLGFAIPVLILAGMHARRRFAFLRLRMPDLQLFLLSAAGLVALIPVVQWSAAVNDMIPLPEGIRQFEQMQMELIEQVLLGSTGVIPNLVLLAIVPAVCEELLFRGYVQRQAERGLGIFRGVLITGIVFGLYHMRLSQAIPLCILGIYLGYVVWRTGSLWSGVSVHFLNNGFAVLIGAYMAARGTADYAAVESISIPWYVAVTGAIIVVMVVRAMNHRARVLLRNRSLP